jgi:hypothetical protein
MVWSQIPDVPTATPTGTGTPSPTGTATATRTATGTPSPTRIPTSIPTQPPTITPTPYPQSNIGVQVASAGAGQLQATLTARDAGCVPNNRLRALRITRLTNATLDVPGIGTLTALSAGPIALPDLPPAITLTLHRVTGGASATAELVVTDGCGDWSTFVGGGDAAFTAASLPAAPATTATPPRGGSGR